MAGGQHYWCSSATWVFAQLPKLPANVGDRQKLAGINNFFTGEYDTVLFASSDKPEVVDHARGIVMQPKPLTELDRLSYVVHQLASIYAVPKGSYKFVPSGQAVPNEAFRGLSREDSFKLDNWRFVRSPLDEEIQGKIARAEAVYSSDFQDSVAAEVPFNSWSIHNDVTGTLATLKSHLWPGYMSYHRVNTNIHGYFYMGDGICNKNLAFML